MRQRADEIAGGDLPEGSRIMRQVEPAVAARRAGGRNLRRAHCARWSAWPSARDPVFEAHARRPSIVEHHEGPAGTRPYALRGPALHEGAPCRLPPALPPGPAGRLLHRPPGAAGDRAGRRSTSPPKRTAACATSPAPTSSAPRPRASAPGMKRAPGRPAAWRGAAGPSGRWLRYPPRLAAARQRRQSLRQAPPRLRHPLRQLEGALYGTRAQARIPAGQRPVLSRLHLGVHIPP